VNAIMKENCTKSNKFASNSKSTKILVP